MKQYTEKELSKLIETVEQEFTGYLTKSEAADTAVASLAKSEEKPSEKKEDKKEEKPSDSKEKAPEKKEEAPKMEAKPDAEAKPEHKEGEEKPAEHQEAPKDGDHCDYDDEDHEHMHKMYRSMSRGELKAHHDSVRQALDSHGMEKCGDMSMGKSEDTAKAIEIKAETITLPNPEIELLKSELSAEKAKAADLKKNFDAVQEFLTKLVSKTSAPQGKAITELSVIAKSESAPEEKTLSKSEVNEILMRKASDSKLSKNDREAINSYYLNGSNLNTISHLLKN